MSKIENWNPNEINETFEHVAIERVVEAMELIAHRVRAKTKVGTVSRPMYQSGPYAGQPWTARDAGQLKKSVRVVRKKTKSGKAFTKKRSVRVYIGNYLAHYAAMVEHETPFLRPAFLASLSDARRIIGTK